MRQNFYSVSVIITLLIFYAYGMKTEVFNYKIYPTDNFEIYYSKHELEPILPEVEYILEEVFRDNTEFFNIKFDYKVPFFIYYGYQQFLQNTIVEVSENTGGVTEAFKNRFLVPYTGSKKFLQHVINHEFIHEIEYNILYSGVWRTPLLLKSIFYPNWLMEGLAEYRSSIFNKTQMEMLVRDMTVSDKLIPLEHLHNFAHLKPHMVLPAYEQSAKLMEFIEKEYGKERLVYMLKLYREKFEPNSVLTQTIGVKLNTLQQKFFEEMRTVYNYEITINSMTDLDNDKKLSPYNIYPVHYYSPVIYRDQLICLSDINGKLFFYIIGAKEKPKLLIPKRILEQNVDIIQTDFSRMSVSKNGILCFIGLKNNKSYIFLYNIEKKKVKRLSFSENVDIIVSSYISSDGNFIYFSGIKNCKNMLYKYNLNNQQLTKLKEDENFISQLYVDFGKILYVKEFPCQKQGVNTWQNEICMYDLSTSEEQRLTCLLSDETFPCFVDEENILFISDNDKDYDKKLYGVKNLYMINTINPKTIIQLTNIIGGINYVVASDDKIYILYYRNFNQHIYRYLFKDLYRNVKVVQNDILLSEPVSFSFRDNIRRSFPYRVVFTTDLFLPLVYFSSYEGLLMLLYWQGSDMVGEHNIGVNSVVFGEKNYSVNLQYRFLKLPPVVGLNLNTESFYNYTEQSTNKYIEADLVVSFNIDRLSILNLVLGYLTSTKQYSSLFYEITKYENFVYLSYIRNTLVGKFLEPTQGVYHNLELKVSDRFYNGNFSYSIFRYFMINYIDLGKEHSLFNRIELISSIGKDKKKFYLGGAERISGLWYDELVSSQGCFYRLGWRFPIVYDINYYMWYIFPDFFFKGLYGETFIDTCVDETLKLYSSIGLKFKLYSFVLQSFVFKFELTLGQQFDKNRPLYVYFNILGGI